jgi:TonB-linked SusC/RagA family outer membrane protein
MEQMPRSTCAVRFDHRRQWRAVTTGVVLALPAVALAPLAPPLAGTAAAQPAAQGRVSGVVTVAGGTPLAGVTVRAQGSDSAATTNAQGRYSVSAPANGRLTFSLIGYRRADVAIDGRSTVNVTLERYSPVLEQVVVTGYTGQRRSEITGAVASVNVEATARQTTASVVQRLDATVSGVTVAAGGSPGSRSTVRIRGISSFQNNDPLYIVDGTPVQDTYVNFINPNDIQSIQVLKDASASSIYGSRASNGVIIIETTKRGAAGPPQVSLQARTGIATPYRGLDDIVLTNSVDYFNVVKTAYMNAGFRPDSIQRAIYGRNLYGDVNNPSVPEYIFCGSSNAACANVDPARYSYPNNLIIPGSAGTNWFREVFRTAPLSDVNLNVSGSGPGTAYAVSFNYYDQSGTAIYNRYRRGSVRANTSFTRGRFTVGQNATIVADRSVGGLPDDPGGFAEGGILGRNILMQPVVPVRDISGNFASAKAQGLGNQSNPVRFAFENRNTGNQNGRVFGNVFGNYDLTPRLAFRTTFGGSLGETAGSGYTYITPENSEPNTTNGISEFTNRSTDFTWTNTLRYSRSGGQHSVTVLAGQELNQNRFRTINGSIAALVSTDINSRYIQDALGNATTKNVNSSGFNSSLLSYFGRTDYTFADRYTASLTVRRDGSSRLGPTNRWGTFPAAGLGWRLSRESFLANNRFISDAQLRVGYGVTGNQQIPAGRIVTQFGGGRNQTFYDIAGAGNTAVSGYRQTSIGNENLKWEENRSINAGLDLGLLDNRWNVVVDVYDRVTDNLLFNPPIPATAGTAAAPILNIGKMRNRGTDFSVGYRVPSWSLSFNGSQYRNRIQRIGGGSDFFFGPIATRFGNQVINQVGQPIGAFFGYQADGFFRDAADVTGHAKQNGAAPGRIKFRDVNGDGQVTLADRTVIGSPHPDFTGGLDLTLRRGRWDLAGTVFGSFGNEIFDTQKEAYIFRNFSANVRKDLLENSWTPETADRAKYPRLDVNDTFSQQLSSFYVEDGSYVRMRSLQLGYTMPNTLPGNLRMFQGARVYLQGENLFTITGYDGLDPSLPAANITGAAGDIRDQYRGIDRGSYPTSRTFSLGFVTNF